MRIKSTGAEKNINREIRKVQIKKYFNLSLIKSTGIANRITSLLGPHRFIIFRLYKILLKVFGEYFDQTNG